VRGFDKTLEARLRSLARTRRISLNRAALLLLRRGAGLEEDSAPRDVVGNSLDGFIGDWTDDEARELEQAVSVFETVDADAWK
jgi:hypothetical protein